MDEPTGSSSTTDLERSGHFATPELSSAAGQRGQASELWGERPAKQRRVEGAEASSSHVNVPLCPTQRTVLDRVVSTLDHDSSVVITDARQPDHPIVFVTKPWERMCGFTFAEARGRNPRLTQGAHSDEGSIRQISGALREKRSCKVMMLNYRSGLQDQPFWNMLAISPVLHAGQLMFYLANLQDYTYHMGRLVSLPPTQFCRSAEHFQRARRLPSSSSAAAPRYYARPAIIETDDECALCLSPAHGEPTADDQPALMMRRLGWSRLSLDPEHLAHRVQDALATMEARYELVEGTADTDDLFVINAEIHGVACRVLVTHDPASEGSYRITCSRLGGDTFAYHDAFREMRRLLGDALEGAVSLGTGGAGPRAGKLPASSGAFGALRLAPLPTLPAVPASVELDSSNPS